MLGNKGIIHVAISAFLFGLTPLFAKNIYLLGGNAINLTFHRFLLPLPILFVLVKKHSSSINITKNQLLKIFILSLGFAGTPILLLSSYNYISSGTSTTIHFMYPVLVILAYTIFFDRKLSPVKCACTVLCTVGVILLYTKQQSNLSGIILSFASAITYAFYIIYLDKSGLKTMSSFKLTFYLSAVSMLELLIFSSYTKTLTFNIEPLGWILTMAFVISIAIGATVLFQSGVRVVGPERTAILSNLEPITSMIVGVVVFSESFSLKICLGIVLILLSVILLAVFDKDYDKLSKD